MQNDQVDACAAALEMHFRLWPTLQAGPASRDGLKAIEGFAGFPLPTSYEAFVARFGGGIVGPFRIYGAGACEAMATNERSVIEVTERFRSGQWPGTSRAIVISTDHSGNPITLSSDGRVHLFDHDNWVTEFLAPTFDAFVLCWCLNGE